MSAIRKLSLLHVDTWNEPEYAPISSCIFFFNDTSTTQIYTLSLHDALPICRRVTARSRCVARRAAGSRAARRPRSEEHTSELQSQFHLVCRLLLEKKKTDDAWSASENALSASE